MKIHVALAACSLACAGGAALASEYGTVVSSTAVTAQVPVPQQQCTEQQALVPQRPSGGGALLGAIVGGVVGHSLGDGFGRAAATGLGAVAGSVIGDRVEAANTPPAEVPVRSCQTVTRYETRVVGYDVVYDYAGRRYSTRLARDPGARVALDVTVAPSAGAVATVPPVTAAPAVVYAAAPYGGYDPAGSYAVYGLPAIAYGPRLGYGVVIGGGYRHRGY